MINLIVDAAVRLGFADNEFEGSIAGGVVFNLGRSANPAHREVKQNQDEDLIEQWRRTR